MLASCFIGPDSEPPCGAALLVACLSGIYYRKNARAGVI